MYYIDAAVVLVRAYHQTGIGTNATPFTSNLSLISFCFDSVSFLVLVGEIKGGGVCSASLFLPNGRGGYLLFTKTSISLFPSSFSFPLPGGWPVLPPSLSFPFSYDREAIIINFFHAFSLFHSYDDDREAIISFYISFPFFPAALLYIDRHSVPRRRSNRRTLI